MKPNRNANNVYSLGGGQGSQGQQKVQMVKRMSVAAEPVSSGFYQSQNQFSG